MNSRYLNRACRHLTIVATAAALAFAAGSAVAAQYQWRDAKGRMVYSDQPPPSSIAADRIIRAPSFAPSGQAPGAPDSGGKAVADVASSPASPASNGASIAVSAGVSAGPGNAGLSLADRELAARKRAADRAAEEKKASEEASRKVQLARACSDAQGNIRMLESGQRISRINAAGEREFLSDAERMQRLTEARKHVGERC